MPITSATIMNSDNLPTVENTSPELTVPLTAMLDNSAIIPMPKISSTINTPKIRKAIYENTSSNMLGAINAKFFSEFEIPPLSILQQQKIAELYLLAKKETALLRRLSEEKERYYDLLIRNVHSTMK